MRQVVSIIALVFASFAGVSAQEEQRANRSDESNHPCGHCKTRVVPPPGSLEYKIRIFTPSSDIDYKLKVLCMCPREDAFVAVMPRVSPPIIRRHIPQPYHVPQQSGSDSFVKPPSFSYRLMPDTTRAAPDAPRRYEPKLKQFINHK